MAGQQPAPDRTGLQLDEFENLSLYQQDSTTGATMPYTVIPDYTLPEQPSNYVPFQVQGGPSTSIPPPRTRPSPDPDRPYVCEDEECNFKAFKRQCDLTKHQKNHRKPTLCPYPGCERGGEANGFAEKKDLDRHIRRSHPDLEQQLNLPRDERSCPLEDCSYHGRYDNVRRHILTLHPEYYAQINAQAEDNLDFEYYNLVGGQTGEE
jgi:hypothetical protein